MAASSSQDTSNIGTGAQEPQDRDPSSDSQEESKRTPEWRFPAANVNENPNPASYPQKYKEGETVWVESDAGEWVEAKIKECKLEADWYYLLEDKDGIEVWRDNPTWIHEDDVHPEKDAD